MYKHYLQFHAGLYNSLRGPHTYWLKNGTVDGNADGIVNMLHYEDAATAVIAALQSCNIIYTHYLN